MNQPTSSFFNSKNLYAKLWASKWGDPMHLLYEFISKNELVIGGCRDCSREILSMNTHWIWLGFRIDDFGGLVEESMGKKINRWIWRSHFGLGSLANRLCNTEETAKWLIDRYVSEFRNLFDSRYKNSVDIRYISITYLDEEYHATIATDPWIHEKA